MLARHHLWVAQHGAEGLTRRRAVRAAGLPSTDSSPEPLPPRSELSTGPGWWSGLPVPCRPSCPRELLLRGHGGPTRRPCSALNPPPEALLRVDSAHAGGPRRRPQRARIAASPGRRDEP